MRRRIKDIADVQVGVYAQASDAANAIYIQVGNYSSDRELSEDIKPSVEIEGRRQNLFLNSGDLLFAAKGSNNFCAVFKGLNSPAVASSSFLTLRIKDRDVVLPEYVCWYINLDTTFKYLQSEAKGTGIPSISKATLEELEIPVPSIEKQRTIAEIARLQAEAQRLQSGIITKRRQLIEYKLKKAIENE